MEKILYVSDLDGTLLNERQEMTSFTKNVINRLVKQGMLFSYATARSFITAEKVAGSLIADVPAIVYNGTFIIDRKTGMRMVSNIFSTQQIQQIKGVLNAYNISPIVYSLQGKEKFSFFKKRINSQMQLFLNSRKGDVRENPLTDEQRLYEGRVFYLTCIDEEEKLYSAWQQLKDEYNCIYDKDIYSGRQWLEILPHSASKANAVCQLKQILGCDRVISFGDAINDCTMFQISNECYAVSNADKRLKKEATGVIAGNNEDAVARWLMENRKI